MLPNYLCLFFARSFLVIIFFYFSFPVIVTLGYLYVKRHPLLWSQTLYGIYLGIRSVASGLCLLVVVPYMKNTLKFRDTTIVLMSLVASAVSEVFFGLSIETWMVFAGILCHVYPVLINGTIKAAS